MLLEPAASRSRRWQRQEGKNRFLMISTDDHGTDSTTSLDGIILAIYKTALVKIIEPIRSVDFFATRVICTWRGFAKDVH